MGGKMMVIFNIRMLHYMIFTNGIMQYFKI